MKMNMAILGGSLAALISFAEEGKTPWMNSDEGLYCQMFFVSNNESTGPQAATWEGDGFAERENHSYLAPEHNFVELEDSLAMLEFGVGINPDRYSEEPGYVALDFDVDTTADGRLGFFVYQGGYRNGAPEEQPSAMTQRLFTPEQWKAQGRKISLTAQLQPDVYNKYESVRVECAIRAY